MLSGYLWLGAWLGITALLSSVFGWGWGGRILILITLPFVAAGLIHLYTRGIMGLIVLIVIVTATWALTDHLQWNWGWRYLTFVACCVTSLFVWTSWDESVRRAQMERCPNCGEMTQPIWVLIDRPEGRFHYQCRTCKHSILNSRAFPRRCAEQAWCPECKSVMENEDWRQCNRCGYERPKPEEDDTEDRCPGCGFTYAFDGFSCQHCGYSQLEGSAYTSTWAKRKSRDAKPGDSCPQCKSLWNGELCPKCGFRASDSYFDD